MPSKLKAVNGVLNKHRSHSTGQRFWSRPDGRPVYFNAMNGNLVELDIRKRMQKRISIRGSTLRAPDSGFKIALAQEIEKFVWPLIKAGKFKPLPTSS